MFVFLIVEKLLRQDLLLIFLAFWWWIDRQTFLNFGSVKHKVLLKKETALSVKIWSKLFHYSYYCEASREGWSLFMLFLETLIVLKIKHLDVLLFLLRQTRKWKKILVIFYQSKGHIKRQWDICLGSRWNSAPGFTA